MDFFKRKPEDPLSECLEAAIDIARTAGASKALVARMEKHRADPLGFLRDPGLTLETDPDAPPTTQFGLALYGQLQDDGIVYMADPGDFPENVPINFLPILKRFGFRWEPRDLELDVPRIQCKLIAPDGAAVEAELATPGGLAHGDAEQVLDFLVELVRRTSLGVYEIDIQSEQHWLLVTPKASYEALQKRYGTRWERYFSVDGDWGASPK